MVFNWRRATQRYDNIIIIIICKKLQKVIYVRTAESIYIFVNTVLNAFWILLNILIQKRMLLASIVYGISSRHKLQQYCWCYIYICVRAGEYMMIHQHHFSRHYKWVEIYIFISGSRDGCAKNIYKKKTQMFQSPTSTKKYM